VRCVADGKKTPGSPIHNVVENRKSELAENAPTERIFRTPKVEHIDHGVYATRVEAR